MVLQAQEGVRLEDMPPKLQEFVDAPFITLASGLKPTSAARAAWASFCKRHHWAGSRRRQGGGTRQEGKQAIDDACKNSRNRLCLKWCPYGVGVFTRPKKSFTKGEYACTFGGDAGPLAADGSFIR